MAGTGVTPAPPLRAGNLISSHGRAINRSSALYALYGKFRGAECGLVRLSADRLREVA